MITITQRHIGLFDLHIPHHIKLDGVYKFIENYKPTHLILGGDYLDCQYASHWQEKAFTLLGLEKISKCLHQEFEEGKKVLRELNSILPKDCKKYYIPGNHELFLLWACMTYPAIAGSVDLGANKITFRSDLDKIKNKILANLIVKFLDANILGYRVLPYNKELILGKLLYTHGHQVNTMTALKKRYPAVSVVAGHHHSHVVDTLHNSGNNSRAIQYVQVPCLCKLSPGYLKDGSTRWLGGFWAADVLSNGMFAGHVVKVLDGRVVEGGRVYE